MKSFFYKCFRKPISIFIFFIFLNSFGSGLLNAEDSYFNEMQIDGSTNFGEKNSDLPTNPFEIVEMIRRANSMNDATKPSDAIDDALKSYNMIDEVEGI